MGLSGKMKTSEAKPRFWLYKLYENLCSFLRCGRLGEEQVWGLRWKLKT